MKSDNLLNDGRKLPIMERFYSIQGEGFHTGKAAYFLRIGGCDVGCAWCDIPESWNSKIHPLIDVDEIIPDIIENVSKSVVITGGEPLLYNLNYLCSELKKNDVKIHLETSGTGKYNGYFDWVCFSPKRNTNPDTEIYKRANELKVIVSNVEDLEWATYNEKKVSSECHLYLQPEWSKMKTISPDIVDFVLQNPQWHISLQTHKFLRIP